MTSDDEHVPLSYGERTAWTTAVTVPLGTVGYLVVVVPRVLRENVADVAWAGPMLWSMGFTLVAGVVGAILLAIVTREHDTSHDVRDTQIERYGDRIALVGTAAGAFAVLVLAMLEVDWFWIGTTLFLLGAIGTTAGAVAQLRAYRGAFVG